MHTLHIGRLRALSGIKIAFCAALTLVVIWPAAGQTKRQLSKSSAKPVRYERPVSYGFTLGAQVSKYNVRYSDRFVTQDFDTLHSVMTPFLPGFSLGFLVNFRINSFFDVRLMPKASFYQHRLEYNYTSTKTSGYLIETAVVELPVLLKYNSIRRGALGLYLVGGITPGFEASGKNDEREQSVRIDVGRWNLSLDLGIGLDIYLPLFKMSPEVRFSGGVLNLLRSNNGPFNEPLRRIDSSTIAFYLTFQ